MATNIYRAKEIATIYNSIKQGYIIYNIYIVLLYVSPNSPPITCNMVINCLKYRVFPSHIIYIQHLQQKK